MSNDGGNTRTPRSAAPVASNNFDPTQADVRNEGIDVVPAQPEPTVDIALTATALRRLLGVLRQLRTRIYGKSK